MKEIKELAIAGFLAINKSNNNKFMKLIEKSWDLKKTTSSKISNKKIIKIEKILKELEINSFKITGAGGGGFLMVFCHPSIRFDLINEMKQVNTEYHYFDFAFKGVQSWKIT